MLFRDRKQGPRCWRQFKSATKAIRQQEITFETEKNLKFVKTQKWSKLKNFTSWDQKSVHPPDFGKAKPEQPEVKADG